MSSMVHMLVSLGVLQASTSAITPKEFSDFIASMARAQEHKDLRFIKEHTSLDIVYATREGTVLDYNKLIAQVIVSFRASEKTEVQRTIIKFVNDHGLIEDVTTMNFHDKKGKSHTVRVRSRTAEYLKRENGILKYSKIQELPGGSMSRDGKTIKPTGSSG